ncbi:hypothetical protein FZ983_32190 [Azospirillum sp. B21]|uniref:hypothetical protein n=1 Tax=Azospirillum sp. B21 TaxID=2607496 RepID=UPI0011EF67E6|nr:hypothetical protein [Azospirillum sp. B21]KAA0572232.1 hypothetical protein FZ983_32190 [Azospirillum sp. B21]
MSLLPLSDEFKALGFAMGEAGARFDREPTHINRASYLHAIRRVVEHQFRGQPRAIRLLMDIHQRQTELASAPQDGASQEAAE